MFYCWYSCRSSGSGICKKKIFHLSNANSKRKSDRGSDRESDRTRESNGNSDERSAADSIRESNITKSSRQIISSVQQKKPEWENSTQKKLIDFFRKNIEEFPDKLKILIFDRINLWHRANDCRNKRLASQDPEERFYLTLNEVELRKENKQIWDELEHFVNTGKVLGKHKAFIFEQILSEFVLIEPKALVQKYHLIPNYIFKAKKRLEDISDPSEIARVNKRIEFYNVQLRAIKTILKII